ncbi:MAG: hypothetical protein BECKG1743D_GA0114223_107722 [Candidatus Kentron sp. G]|nr:MAG: hypothetical protein BECKG1743F_GA0114225_108782 [Candidatus Kentron sp. G]VFN05812.1 MAG: hypothetical protein BECKG1743D_GA0114223_107722 [Candidatus Kentron sp. G]VFN07170.1 MAG: hypothetical protein BECKG1743E_GA0114224_111491 [Candidatus Kentron sp. G]
MTLLVAWYWSRGRRPSLSGLFLGVLAISLAVLAVFSHRSDIRVGADVDFDFSRLIENVAPESVLIANTWIGNEYAAGIATVLTSDYHHDYYWGYRYFVTFLIRPIPRQIWPTKYEDMNADWLRHEDSYVMERSIAAVGHPLVNGASTGSIADVYMEFAWGVVLVFYLLGRAFGLAWRRHRMRGGIWSVWLIAMLVLSIYLPTQSFSAWLHRLLFMGVVTSLFWRFWIRPRRVVGRREER